MIEQKEAIYEKVVLVGIQLPKQDPEETKEHLDELAFLSQTAGAEVQNVFVQNRPTIHPKTFVGSGKLIEIKNYVDEEDIDSVIFDEELSPSQLMNLEKFLERKIIDRTSLILDIFAQRAKTSYARTQVELAQHVYFLPRLTNLWTHLERQRGGIGMRGPGETEIETDRRIIRDRIKLLRDKLSKIDRQMSVQRQGRGSLIRIALVGYTNAGKSTLMNALSKSDVFVEDKLFATLDTTVRKVVIGNLPFLLSDTVGFIRKLPTQLVESFKSTLDEIKEADLLLHVVDVSHKNFEDHLHTVERTLSEIGCSDIPKLILLNKADLFEAHQKSLKKEDQFSLNHLSKGMEKSTGKKVFTFSALRKADVSELKKILYQTVLELHKKSYPYDQTLFQYYDDLGNPSD